MIIQKPSHGVIDSSMLIIYDIDEMEHNKQKDYFTVEELAGRWDVTRQAVRNWIAEGVFPNAYKVGPGSRSPIRVPIDDVLTFEKSRKIVDR